jgi:hypothetical protein
MDDDSPALGETVQNRISDKTGLGVEIPILEPVSW